MKIIKKTILTILIMLLLSILVQLNNNVYGIETNEHSETITIIESMSKKLIGDVSVNTVEYLYNLDGSPDYIYVRYKNNGYAVFSSNTLNILEFSLDGDLPYQELSKKYYAGPTNYVNKIDGKYKNINTNEYITNDQKELIVEETKYILSNQEVHNLGIINNYELNAINEELLGKQNSKVFNNDISTPSIIEETIQDELVAEPVYIENYEYFMIGPHHGENLTGTCSAVSAQLLLGFHNYYNDRRIIDDKYLFSGEYSPKYCINPMKIDSFIIGTKGTKEYATNEEDNYFAKIVSKIPKSSNNSVIVNGINELLSERELEFDENIYFGRASNGADLTVIKNEIDAGRPVIISMTTGTTANHSVVGYGYQSLNTSNNECDEVFGYIVHCGYGNSENWKYKTNVWINKDWCYNYVKFETTHTHNYGSPGGDYYEKKCECGHRTSEFPFEIEESNGKITITGANFLAPMDLIIPSKINGIPVTRISENAFSNNYRIQNLIIPKTIEEIEYAAFSGCRSLNSITLPFVGYSRNAVNSLACLGHIFGKIHYIGSESIIQNGETYYFPTNLTSVTVTDTPIINNNAFENCSNLKNIYLFCGLRNIGNSSFNGCSQINEIIIPNTVTSIGNNAFKNCTFDNIIIPSSVSYIGEDAFMPEVLVEWIYNPSITAETLSINELLDIVRVEQGVRNISPNAFKNCVNLTTVELSSDISSIDITAFEGCTSLLDVRWYYNPHYTVSDIGGNFNEILTTIIFPKYINEIKEGAFKNCDNIDYLEIPETIEMINRESFAYCDNLSNITLLRDTNQITTISSEAFIGCNSLRIIKVPTEKLFLYKYNSEHFDYKNLFVPNSDFESEELEGQKLIKTYYIKPGKNILRKLNIEYDYIYSFNIEGNESLSIKLYNENYNLVTIIPFNESTDNYNYEICLKKGSYYIDIYHIDSSNYGNINLTIEFTEEYDLYFNTEHSISNHLIEYGTEYISLLKYNHLGKNGLYKISINNISNSDLEEGTITIYTNKERTSVLESYNITDFVNEAITKTGDNSLYVYLHKNTTYYINIKLNDNFQDVKIKIENLLDTELSIFNQSNIMSAQFINVLNLNDNTDNTSHFKKLIIKENGIFTTVVNYEGTQSTDIKVLFFGINSDGEYTNLNTLTLNSTKKSITISYRELYAGEYCIGYYNLDKSKCSSLDVSFSRFIDNGSDSVYNGLMVDPNAPGMYGSQIAIVERNKVNKSYGETYITKGFTRLLFIDSSYDYPTSRTQYEWYSSDENILTVSNYGTVLGISEGTAKVIGININNPGIIFIKEFTVVDNVDEEVHIVEINQTYSLSSDDELILDLKASNCPYPYIQYYDFGITSCEGLADMSTFGRVIPYTAGEIIVEGIYSLNNNYIVKVTIDVNT